jgi:hypothetical protein
LIYDTKAIPVENRAQFLQDSIAFSEARIIDATIPFKLMQYLVEETKELPWLAIVNRVSYFYNMLVQTSAYGDYQSYTSALLRQYYIKYDWEEDLSKDSWLER